MTYNSTQDWPEDPFPLLRQWIAEAEEQEPNDPTAISLATVARNGMPSVRMVLLKDYDHRGFVFYTNSHSRKGEELAEHMKAGLCLYWKSTRKQVRASGRVEMISKEEADSYFASRPRESRIGAWASEQSRPLDHRSTFEQRITQYEAKFEEAETVPRPPHWNGYRIKPEEIEFWINERHRLHRRCVYTPLNKDYTTWTRQMLFP